MRLLPNRQGGLPKVRPEVGRNSAIELVRDNLAIFANMRGGQLRSSSFVVIRRQARLHDNRRVPLPSLMTMVLMVSASSIGARWAPQSRGTHSCAHTIKEGGIGRHSKEAKAEERMSYPEANKTRATMLAMYAGDTSGLRAILMHQAVPLTRGTAQCPKSLWYGQWHGPMNI
ncbi:hypothetical protein BDR06DRAFT_1009845 [Suillus hirtellus]|nr:hypothetical protein BDR06DRAFT_1009845 [Suillus hirtellus]